MAYTTRFGQSDDYRRDELIRKIEHSFDVKSENNVKNGRNRQTLWGDGVRMLTQKLVAKRYMIA